MRKGLLTCLSALTFFCAQAQEQPKTGWKFTPMPNISYNTDIGLNLGAFCDFFYYGEFEKRYEGNGHLRWNEVDFIDGIFQDGWIEQGVGSVHLVGGRHYEGQFMNGYAQGFGHMIYADGRVEEGVFSQGKYSGKY